MSPQERVHRYAGDPVLEVVVRQQNGKKKVVQRLVLPDGDYVYALNGFQAPLYRRDVIEAANPGALWCFPEGEKDCDRLVSLGFQATTNSMGTAGWRDELALGLSGLIVAILPDMDQPGVELAEKKLAALVSAGIRARIAWLPFPVTKNHGKDVSDWLDEGHTAEELKQLIREAFKGEPQPAPVMEKEEGLGPAPRFVILSEAELMEQPDPSWQITNTLEARELSLIYGVSGAGKTFVVTDMLMALLTGNPWCDRTVTPSDVLYVNADGGMGFKKRVKAWRAAHPAPSDSKLWTIESNVNLFNAQDVLAFVQAVEEHGKQPGLIAIDTLSRCTVGADEISTRDMGQVADSCQQMIQRLGSSIMLVHHATKDGLSARGVASLTNSACTVLKVEGAMGLVSLKCEKQRNWAAFEPLTFRLVQEGDSAVLSPTNEGAITVSGRTVEVMRVLEQVKATPGMTAPALALVLNMVEGSLRRYVAGLLEEGLVTVEDTMGDSSGRRPKGVFPTKKALY